MNTNIAEREPQSPQESYPGAGEQKYLSSTLVVPTLNERDGLEVILPRIDPRWVDDILFIDGGSTDGSQEVIRRWGHGRRVQQKLPGLCNAYWEALGMISTDLVLAFSPDGNSVPEAIPALLAKAGEGYDMVVASRYLPGAGSQDDGPVTALGNWMFTRAINLLFGSRTTDALVMYRVYRRKLIEEVRLDTRGRDFEPQLGIRCALYGKRVTEIAVPEPRRIGGVRKMSPMLNGWAIVTLIASEWVRSRRMNANPKEG